MNARIRNNRVANIVGTNGEATLNSNGRKLIDFCTFNNLKIMNTFFKHKEIHKFTWEARGRKSIIDYFITNFDRKQYQFLSGTFQFQNIFYV